MNDKGVVGTALEPAIVRNALKVSLVVGTVLNIVNQGSAVIDGQPVAISQLLLNFLVPYVVSSYSAACHEVNRRRASTTVAR